MNKLVLLRHGESLWNKEGKFTGWTDVDLSEQGMKEARKAGHLIEAAGIVFEEAHTSVLKRAIRTLWLVLEELDQMWIPEYTNWRLNERHYGALQGLNKKTTAQEYGEQQVFEWRRGFAVRPPALSIKDERHPKYDPRYAHLDTVDLPATESLKDTLNRVMPYWEETIVPKIKQGKDLLIVAHGNSLRAIIKHLENISDEDIPGLNIPTGYPLVYEFGKNQQLQDHYYLGNQEEITEATNQVLAQSSLVAEH